MKKLVIFILGIVSLGMGEIKSQEVLIYNASEYIDASPTLGRHYEGASYLYTIVDSEAHGYNLSECYHSKEDMRYYFVQYTNGSLNDFFASSKQVILTDLKFSEFIPQEFTYFASLGDWASDSYEEVYMQKVNGVLNWIIFQKKDYSEMYEELKKIEDEALKLK